MFGESPLDVWVSTFRLLFVVAPYFLPFLLGYGLLTIWRNYKQIQYMSKMKWVILEITPPPEAQKTPLSMEVVLMALHQPNPGNPFERFFLGQIRRWSSLEIISIGGDVRFLVRTEERHKNFFEAQMYAQYPSVEIREVPDYVYDVDWHPGSTEWKMFGIEYGLSKPDPYPIRTYVDFQLDKPVQKDIVEETKTDPLNSIIEIFGSVGPHEQMWLQLLIRATGKTYRDPGTWFGRRDWKGEAKAILSELKEKAKEGNATKGEQDAMSAIEREISKPAYDCGIRALYVAKAESFQPGMQTALRGMMRPFGSESLNGFKTEEATSSEYPFENWDYNIGKFRFKRVETIQREMFDAYQQRSYFYLPYRRNYFVLNVEELATLYHIPNKAAQTPGLARIGSHKGTPPTNLPI